MCQALAGKLAGSAWCGETLDWFGGGDSGDVGLASDLLSDSHEN